MTKIKGLFRALVVAASAPELRPLEVKLARAIVAAAVAYFGIHYGMKA